MIERNEDTETRVNLTILKSRAYAAEYSLALADDFLRSCASALGLDPNGRRPDLQRAVLAHMARLAHATRHSNIVTFTPNGRGGKK